MPIYRTAPGYRMQIGVGAAALLIDDRGADVPFDRVDELLATAAARGITVLLGGDTVAPNAEQPLTVAAGDGRYTRKATGGTASTSTFLRGDLTWATPAGGGATTPDATDTVKGKAVLLGGTADNPTVPWSKLTRAVRAVSTDTTAVVGEVLLVDASGGNRTITPPNLPGTGVSVTVAKTDASANTVTWTGATNGDPNAVFVSRWAVATLLWAGTQWVVSA